MHTPDLGRYERTATGTTTLSHPEGSARITRLPDRYAVEATVLRAGAAPETLRRITDYDPRTVAILLEDVGPEALCDALERMAPDSYMGRLLAAQVTSYLDPASLAGKRLLDFGSGYGASTFILARLLPDTEIVGIELEAQLVERATRLVPDADAGRIRFHCSPSGTELPPDMGTFDAVMLSAVYEHLLPAEREEVLPKLWAAMKPGAVVFVNQTPHRWFPWDHHSTALWGINYLPAGLAARYASRCARMNVGYNRRAGRNWAVHLRGGLRGGTERSIVQHLTAGRPDAARILQPIRHRDRAAYWLAQTSPRHRRIKRIIAQAFRWSERLFGTIPGMNVDVVIQKAGEGNGQ